MSGPAYVNTFSQFQPGVIYWVQAKEAFTVTFGE
jgi:hypothetical protein